MTPVVAAAAPLRAAPTVRVLRAVVLTAVVAGFGAGTHAAAGGLLPGPVVVLPLLAGLALVHAAALSGPVSTRRLVVLVAGGQAAVHLVLTALAGHRGVPVPTASVAAPEATTAALAPAAVVVDGSRRGSLRDLYEITAPAPSGDAAVPPWLGHVLADLSGPHALMALAHLVAAAGVGLWLAAGEQALWSLVCLLGGTATAVLAALVALGGLRAARIPSPTSSPRGAARRVVAALPAPLLGALARRGPPVPALA